MALNPIDEAHRKRILAGINGRKKGHKFESLLAEAINNLEISSLPRKPLTHLETGNPASLLLDYIEQRLGVTFISVNATWTGGFATTEEGNIFLDERGKPLRGSKTDVLIDAETSMGFKHIGISCKASKYNAQMFCTTANAFCNILQNNGISVSINAREAMQRFCGDLNFRPVDLLKKDILVKRVSRHDRFFWEELPSAEKNDWAMIFSKYQDLITKILFTTASYPNDPQSPSFLIQKAENSKNFDNSKVAIFAIDEIVALSRAYSGFTLSKYRDVRRKDPAIHYAPRFGFIQFQRLGNKQNLTQLQFNLKTGYYNHLPV